MSWQTQEYGTAIRSRAASSSDLRGGWWGASPACGQGFGASGALCGVVLEGALAVADEGGEVGVVGAPVQAMFRWTLSVVVMVKSVSGNSSVSFLARSVSGVWAR
ncbi:hypothetical protein DR950_17655 [Kitasatospora xanthocidica]|uniref:Uncharacterized protein n=1 Tax=Kitasatospora xanthocidica TaxID=83382 RepID=A0A372ZU24_9ACTN|nr:hypothetical protein DR950_17655 [Kitasatospora xanthocidica]